MRLLILVLVVLCKPGGAFRLFNQYNFLPKVGSIKQQLLDSLELDLMFTSRARSSIDKLSLYAEKDKNAEPHHLLQSLLGEGVNGHARRILSAAGVNKKLMETLDFHPKNFSGSSVSGNISDATLQCLSRANSIREILMDDLIGTQHLLLACVDATNLTKDFFGRLDCTYDVLENTVIKLRLDLQLEGMSYEFCSVQSRDLLSVDLLIELKSLPVINKTGIVTLNKPFEYPVAIESKETCCDQLLVRQCDLDAWRYYLQCSYKRRIHFIVVGPAGVGKVSIFQFIKVIIISACDSRGWECSL